MKRIKIVGRALSFLMIFLYIFSYNSIGARAADNGVTAVVRGVKEMSGDTLDLSGENSYTGKMVSLDGSSERISLIPVTVPEAGLLFLNYKGDQIGKVSLTLYSDKNCEKEISHTELMDDNDAVMAKGLPVLEAGTYYLKIQMDSVSDVDYCISACIYSSEDKTLTDGQVCYAALMDKKDSNDYRIYLSKDTMIRVYISAEDGSENGPAADTVCPAAVSIYDFHQKQVAKLTSSSQGALTGLKKGIYYIRLSDGGGCSYKIHYQELKAADHSASREEKASTISIGKTVTGFVLATDSTGQEDWYRLVSTESKATKIYFSGETSGKIQLEFFDSGGDSFGTLTIDSGKSERSASPYVGNYGDAKGKLPKGSYYIRVRKLEEDCSGYYSITVEQ